ncbi:MAG: helix-turn-helix domain-containing protein [Verrucomicrobiae bacterium]|nr:helix-turn-helix domain-containing protein [Verrucomicrobiae bacterium]
MHDTPSSSGIVSSGIVAKAEATKPVYTVAEFAALFNRHKSWAYRLIYNGKINVISEFGLMMIPANEVDKIVATAGRYTGK